MVDGRVWRGVGAALLVWGALAGASVARAEVVTLAGDMKGTNESPPNDSPATGRAEAKFDTGTRQLSYTVTYSGLTGPAAGAHFHGPAEPGKNAGIVVPFAVAASPITGIDPWGRIRHPNLTVTVCDGVGLIEEINERRDRR